jgi:flagellar biosynthesis protein FlhF
MKIKRLNAANIREAMRKIREELGPDAVILSNQRSEAALKSSRRSTTTKNCCKGMPLPAAAEAFARTRAAMSPKRMRPATRTRMGMPAAGRAAGERHPDDPPPRPFPTPQTTQSTSAEPAAVRRASTSRAWSGRRTRC